MAIQDLADVFNNLQAAMASSERIFGVLDTPVSILDKPDARRLDRFEGRVDMENVWFAYDGAVTTETPDSDERWTVPVFPLKAADFMKRGVRPGPALGAALHEAEEAWIAADFPADPQVIAAIADASVAEVRPM